MTPQEKLLKEILLELKEIRKLLSTPLVEQVQNEPDLDQPDLETEEWNRRFGGKGE